MRSLRRGQSPPSLEPRPPASTGRCTLSRRPAACARSRPPRRTLCTDCGISRMADPQALRPRLPVHPARLRRRWRRACMAARATRRARTSCISAPSAACCAPRWRAAAEGAQWTGITTRIAERLLETGAVDAVLTMAPDPDDRWQPGAGAGDRRRRHGACRGMRMGYAPLLALLEPARGGGHKRARGHRHPLPGLCAARAGSRARLRAALRHRHALLRQHHDRALPRIPRAGRRPAPETITYLEFRADYHVEIRFADGRKREIPFLHAAAVATCRAISSR